MSVSVSTRKFRRTDIGPREKIVGASIILLLVGIAATIAVKGRQFDPSRYTGDADALEFTREAVTGIASTIRNEADLRASESIGVADKPSSVVTAGELPPYIDKLSPMGPTEIYLPDTLYEKINGRAPAYLEYNFEQLTCRSFTITGVAGAFVDVYLFRMDSPINAFGIFSAERDPSGTALEFVSDGYASEMGYFLRLGDVYGQILASSTDPVVMAAALDFTRELANALPPNSSGMEGRDFLPAKNQIPGSLTYINENAYGQASLGAVFEARYLFGNQEITYFVKSAGEMTAAEEIWASLREFYDNYGTEMQQFEQAGARVFSADLFGQWTAIYLLDGVVAGVVDAPDRATAINFLGAQLEALADVPEELDEYNL